MNFIRTETIISALTSAILNAADATETGELERRLLEIKESKIAAFGRLGPEEIGAIRVRLRS